MKTRTIALAATAAVVSTLTATVDAAEVVLATPSNTGTFANHANLYPSVSADGRYLVYQSRATNLVANDTNNADDIFIYDRSSGQVSLLSVTPGGTQANGSSTFPAISADGRFVVFVSKASNLVTSDANGRADTFVLDRNTGAIRMISTASDSSQRNSDSGAGRVSADGRYVAFQTFAAFDPQDTNGVSDVYLKDTLLGTTTWISKGINANPATHGGALLPAISGNGNVITWEANGTGHVAADTNGFNDIVVEDLTSGERRRVSVDSIGRQSNGNSERPALSYDGRKIVFTSAAGNLVDSDTSFRKDVFMYNWNDRSVSRISVSETGAQISPYDSIATHGSVMSADGRYVVFEAMSNGVVAGDTNNFSDVFVRDTVDSTTTRVSLASNGDQPDHSVYAGVINSDGRFIGFASWASNLTAQPINTPYAQMYLVDRNNNEIPFASAGPDQIVEATAIQTPVTLDGSGSSDPDEDTLTYTWTGSFGIVSGASPVVELSLGTHEINLSVNDSNDGYDEDAVQIIVQDTTPPVLTVPGDIEVIATGLETSVTLGNATATDIFGAVVTSDAPAVFRVGETVVNYTAADPNGNESTAQQKVLVKYNFGGFMAPLSAGAAYKIGRTLPVKFQLFYADGNLALDATATIHAQRIENDVPVGDPIELESNSNADSGNMFRVADEHYQYNLDTGFASRGTYQLIVEIQDGTTHMIEVAFK
jgi:Tol biopolymer transport system component